MYLKDIKWIYINNDYSIKNITEKLKKKNI